MSEREYRYAERSIGQRFYYNLNRYLALWAMWVCFGFRRYGMHRLPKDGAYLLVANHQSYLDPPIIGVTVRRRQFVPLARIGLFNGRFGAHIRALNSIPIDQGSGDTGAMRKVLAALDQGFPVCIFPEGARTPDGAIHEFKRGAALILKRSKCPVVPVAIEGGFEAWPRHRKRPRMFKRVAVMVGEPIAHDDLGAAPVATIEAAVRKLHGELREKMGRAPVAPASTPEPVRET